MKLRITGRHMDITPALRDYIETRFERLDRYGLKVGSLQIVLDVEKLQHKAEVIGAVNGKRVQAKTATREMYATIDALIDRVDAQFRKWKERLVNHKPGKMKKSRTPARPPAKWGHETHDDSSVERQAVPVLSVAQAQKLFRAEAAQPFMIFVNAENGRVQVVQRAGGGRVAVMEPYAEEGRGFSSLG
jgi:putative sigma-54 modulation protein